MGGHTGDSTGDQIGRRERLEVEPVVGEYARRVEGNILNKSEVE